jgi:hypothetical protein
MRCVLFLIFPDHVWSSVLVSVCCRSLPRCSRRVHKRWLRHRLPLAVVNRTIFRAGTGIQVSSISIPRFFSPRGVSVLISEIIWVWVPYVILGVGLYAMKGAIAVTLGWLS